MKHINKSLHRLAMSSVMMLAGTTILMAQGIKVRGTVTDTKTGDPLIGVTVQEKGSKANAVTDIDGKFEINAERGKTLTFSYVGFITKEAVVKGNNMKIEMGEDNQSLDEVVVVGYGVQKKSSLTGAVSSLKDVDIQSRSITSASEALVGKVAGVNLRSTSGAPGSFGTINIRGFASTYSSDPLYVVDGRQTYNIDGINPNDIESIEVLKDAASASIYGSQAGNGVILVTTKKGKGNGKITYDFQYVSSSIAKKPKLFNAQEYIDYWSSTGLLTKDMIDLDWNGKTDTDWIDAEFGHGNMTRHTVTLSAGNDKGDIYTSFSSLQNNGIVKGDNDKYSRITGMVNASYKIKPWLQITSDTQIRKNIIRNNIPEGSVNRGFFNAVLQMSPLVPTTMTYDELPSNVRQAIDDGKNVFKDKNGRYYSISSARGYNPYVQILKSFNETRNFGINNVTSLNIKPFKGLVYTSRFGITYNNQQANGYTNDYYVGVDYQDWMTANASNATSLSWMWENFANYNFKIKKHSIGAMAGMSFTRSRDFSVSGDVSGNYDGSFGLMLDNPLYYYIQYQASDATKSVSGGDPTYTSKLAYFGRLNYNYDDKYFLEFLFRADGADLSYLSKKKRWGYFPGVSGGWVISSEKFMESTRNWLDFLKVRASWGQNGSLSNLGSFSYRAVIQSNTQYVFGNTMSDVIAGNAPAYTGNDDLKWETSEQIDFGIDTRFFRGRLSFSADYYKKTTKDLIVSNIVPSLIVGNTASPVNAGDMYNKGFELEAGWQDNIGDFSYSVRGTFSYNKNEVTSIHPSLQSGIEGADWLTLKSVTRFDVGHPAWYFYGYKYNGLDQTTGNPIFEDLNGDGQITDADRTDIGCGMPKYNFGLTLTAAWKGFDLTVFGQGAAGGKILNAISRPDGINNLMKDVAGNYWTPTNTSGTKPTYASPDISKYLLSTDNLYSGDYFKISQIELGYSLPRNILSKLYVQNLRLAVSLENFFTFTSYPGLDPEITGSKDIGTAISRGIDYGSYPPMKKVMLNATITF